MDDERAVGPAVDVEFDPIRAKVKRTDERGDSVLRSLAGGPAMGDKFDRFQAILPQAEWRRRWRTIRRPPSS